MKNRKLLFLMPVLLLSLLFWSCTNLDENPVSQVTPDNFFQTEAELLAGVIPVYSSARLFGWSEALHLQEVTSDEIVVPTRGGDWDDGGDWRRLHLQTWTSADGKVNQAWNELYTGVARANAVLENLQQTTSDSPLIPTFIAEVRFLRALFYWWLMDMFGNVPVVTAATTDPDNPPQQNTRQELFEFVVQELTEAIPDLEDVAPTYGRATKGAGNALLATVYLNAEVYSGTARWSECVQACDAVINSGMYALMPVFTDIFALENEGPGNTENIFVSANLAEGGVGFPRMMATLHYAQLPQTPWNGFSVVADFFNRYDPDDDRIGILLVGPQLVLGGPNAGDPAFDRQGSRLSFTVDFPLINATESHGVRILKWPVDPSQNGGDAGNDVAIFRYSHILLAKAEALFNMGNTGEALALVNQVRARSFEPDKDLTTLTADLILDERGFEFIWEGHRRTDLIRHGRFLEAWSLKPASDGAHRNLFPIPQVQLDANPNLVQNPGY